MSDKKIPDFYTNMINTLDNLDSKVNEIQNSIKIFKAMINERIDTEKLPEREKVESNNE
tara:strand:+ start:178 stop:354 length:177 start_codon:yes stop_codon:yes gene_type:complete